MKEIVVLSGKGGTGKTSLTASFAQLIQESIICDADVDAADLHLLTAPSIQERHAFIGGSKALIEKERCTSCGRCRELCRFDAIDDTFAVDFFSCEGCGVCVDLCPENAIAFPEQQCGEWYVSATRFGTMIHARLGAGEENSGRLVSLVRQQARERAEAAGKQMILTDGPPGIGCPVIASLGGASAAVIIVEPTLSGMHDMERVVGLARHFRVPACVCVNKYDINEEITAQIEAFANAQNCQFLGRIAYDTIFVQAMIAGKNILEYEPDGRSAVSIYQIWENLMKSEHMKRKSLHVLPT